jgi:hypothetical protein
MNGKVTLINVHRSIQVRGTAVLGTRGQASTLDHGAHLLAEVQRCLHSASSKGVIRLRLDPVSTTVGVPHQPRSVIILLQESGHLCTRISLIIQAGTRSIPVRPTGAVGIGPYAAGVLLESKKLPHEKMIVVL